MSVRVNLGKHATRWSSLKTRLEYCSIRARWSPASHSFSSIINHFHSTSQSPRLSLQSFTSLNIQPSTTTFTMKFTAAIAGLFAIGAAAAPVAVAEGSEIEARNPGGINYVQNYNGGAANFKYNEGAGTYSANWNGNTDFVVGLGWSTGAAR